MSDRDRTVLVTGASSGIGEACARAFAGAGWRVLCCARRVERIDALVEELRAGGAECHGFEVDVRDAEAVDAAFGDLPAEWKQLDLLVNNAGLSRGLDKVHEGLLSDWHEMIDTNIKGLLHLTRAVVPGMVARGGGQVINVGSIAGREVYPKGNGLLRHQARGRRADQGHAPRPERHRGDGVSTVDPGLVDTEFSSVRYHGDRAKRGRHLRRG